jgi:hypothetical protein
MTAKAQLQSAGDGTAVPSGYVGEIKQFTILTNTIANATNTNIASIVLNKGIYLILSKLEIQTNTATWGADPYLGASISTVSASYNGANESHIHIISSGVRGLRLVEPFTISSDNTTLYIVARHGATSGAVTVDAVNYPQFHCAIRIA